MLPKASVIYKCLNCNQQHHKHKIKQGMCDVMHSISMHSLSFFYNTQEQVSCFDITVVYTWTHLPRNLFFYASIVQKWYSCGGKKLRLCGISPSLVAACIICFSERSHFTSLIIN